MHDRPPSPVAAQLRPTAAGRRAPSVGHRWRRALLGAVVFSAGSNGALAYTATLTPAAPQTVYLQVGVGSFTNYYINGGQPGNNATINSVSTTVAAAVVCAGQLALSGAAPWRVVLPAMAGVHMVIGLGEALTGLTLGAQHLRLLLQPLDHLRHARHLLPLGVGQGCEHREHRPAEHQLRRVGRGDGARQTVCG